MPSEGDRLLMMRDEHRLTQAELAARAGFAPSKVSRHESGESKMRADDRARYARALGMDLDEFEGKLSGRLSLHNHEQGGNTRSAARGVHPIEPSPQKGSNAPRRSDLIPVINSAPAGPVVNYEEYGVDSTQGFRYIDRGTLEGDHLFAVEVVGHSMEPTIFEGDTLVFRWMNGHDGHPPLAPGQVVFVRFTQESGHDGCTIARWTTRESGRVIRLIKDNEKYPAIEVPREHVEQVGRAEERRTRRM